jgi:hypothetical protein
VPDASHEVVVDNPGVFFARVRRFVASLPEAL